MPAFKRFAPTLLLVAPILLSAESAQGQEGWEDDLAAEILALEDCTVIFLSQIVEREVGGRQLVMAKAHCEDGRVFDATREDLFQPFDFRACEPVDEPSVC